MVIFGRGALVLRMRKQMNAIQRPKFDPKKFYEAFRDRLETARVATGLMRPLTYAEKILLAHLHEPGTQEWEPGEATLSLNVDHVAMQDATAQMAILQLLMLRQHGVLQKVALASSTHCDHLIVAEKGVEEDLPAAMTENEEVFRFLAEACSVLGIEFTAPAAGIIHQYVLEQLAYPGMVLIGTDSHTPNAGGVGAFAVGIGGADAAIALAGLSWEVLHPRKIGVRLTGELKGFASPKDVITRLCAILTTSGGTNKVVEYFGPGVASLSATGRATICNMGAELGATTSIFPVDVRTTAYLRATGRQELADAVMANQDLFTCDAGVEQDPANYFDEVVEINLSELEPHVVGPNRPDLGRFVSAFKAELQANDWPVEISAAFVGSCTNSSIEDIAAVAAVCEEALDNGLTLKVPFFLSPGSKRTLETARKLGYLEILERAGVTLLANACGPCIGQFKRPNAGKNTVVTSFNRNFPARLDGDANTHVFITSPTMVAIYAFAGRIDFDPAMDTIMTPDDTMAIMLTAPRAVGLPTDGFVSFEEVPALEVDEVMIQSGSDRLEFLTPFAAPDITVPIKVALLSKFTGATTTDAISPAGRWLNWRGHLTRISEGMLLGGINTFIPDVKGKVKDLLDIEGGQPLVAPATFAKKLRDLGVPWAIVGGKNYGEGSSREHAALSPRLLGGQVVIAKSFARIHEQNLKLQGIVPLTFVDEADYDRILEGDVIILPAIQDLAPKTVVSARLEHTDGSTEEISLIHTLTAEQLEWIKAGSRLNTLIANAKAA